MRNYGDLIRELRSRADFEFVLEGLEDGKLLRSEIFRKAADAIEDLQNVVEGDVEEGEWTEWYDKNEHPLLARNFRCSVCGRNNTYGMPPYCMYCGAKMRERIRNVPVSEM